MLMCSDDEQMVADAFHVTHLGYKWIVCECYKKVSIQPVIRYGKQTNIQIVNNAVINNSMINGRDCYGSHKFETH